MADVQQVAWRQSGDVTNVEQQGTLPALQIMRIVSPAKASEASLP